MNSYKILKFGEYRKGSNEYGEFIQELMMFLRSFKKDENVLIFPIKNIKFDINSLFKLKNDINKKKLVSFDFIFTDKNKNEVNIIDKNGYVIFYNLNKKTEDRPWENLKFNN